MIQMLPPPLLNYTLSSASHQASEGQGYRGMSMRAPLLHLVWPKRCIASHCDVWQRLHRRWSPNASQIAMRYRLNYALYIYISHIYLIYISHIYLIYYIIYISYIFIYIHIFFYIFYLYWNITFGHRPFFNVVHFSHITLATYLSNPWWQVTQYHDVKQVTI